MVLLIIGFILWTTAHLFKRLVPQNYTQLEQKMGAGVLRGLIAAEIAVGLMLMIIGYRSAPHIAIYTPFAGIGHLNNLLMLLAVMLIGMSHSTGRIGTLLRHPMLLAVVVWSIAHLLVNGDLASLVLFGGLGVWALLEILVINRAEGAWTRPTAGPLKKDIILIVITIVVFGVITAIHTALGYNPFLGTYA
ncbi:membrane protein [Amylibacter marinus]|uniref:Membrane protein n=1 Tax=Amylibacter marinus TaxID=1475483 RepID=A0ABQ5VTN5_9RHOB|nr:NnrU family protein [Amylibacter marinus]GLQ34514.1 membrane protein [Amylibacter marinus]